MDRLWKQWGRNIANGRKVAGFEHQNQLATHLGVRPSTVCKWEAGKPPTDVHKVAIAAALRQEVRALFPLEAVLVEVFV